MVELLALGYTAVALTGLWWLRKETKRIAEEVVANDTRWMVDEIESLRRSTRRLEGSESSGRLISGKLLKSLK